MSHKLNPSQQQAVEYTSGPLLIVAGAGTGKTTVITEKIAYLVKEELAKPEEILAVTFTDKAAGEMEERVDELLDIGYTDLQISTFHAFCQRILERHGIDIGISNSFKLLTQTDAWLLVKQNLDKFNLDYYRPLGNPTRHIHELLKHFSKCKDELISPEEYLDYAEKLKLEKGDVNTEEKSRLTEVANAYHTYNQLLLDNNALDFGDLIFYTVKLLKDRPNILASLQKRFKYILVDEFQDVNWAQYEFIKLLAGENSQLTAVGDDDQSIYAFRGSSVFNILRFKDDFPKAKEIVLNENYRSAQEILDCAYESVQNNNPDRLEEKLGINKKLLFKGEGERGKGKVVEHIQCETLEDEVQTVIEKIAELKKKNKDATWDDFAILVRANNHAESFLNALEKAEIPYEYLASSGLYRQPVVLDCVNFFKVIDQYHESTAIYRLLRMPFLNFAESDIQKLTAFAKKKAVSYYAAIKRGAEFYMSKEGIKVCDNLVKWIHEGMKETRYNKPTTILYNFLEKSGYLKYLTHEESQGNRAVIRQIYQLKQFLDYVNSYERITPQADVAGFMEHFNNVLEAGDDGKMYQVKDTPDSVNIMTIHGSKGLEFKYVFIVNLVEQRFPTRRRGDSIEIPAELIKEQLPEGDFHYQEERRLFYVAMTRAKSKLFLMSGKNYGGIRNNKISRFLDELGFSKDSDIEEKKLEIRNKKLGDKIPISNFQFPISDKQLKDGGAFDFELPSTFSFSALNSYQRCPYQYKLAHILKIPMKGSPSFSFGNTMHHTMQEFYNRLMQLNSARQGDLFDIGGAGRDLPVQDGANKKIKIPSLDELLEIYEKKWIDDWFKSKKQKDDYKKKGKDILKVFYKSHEEVGWTIPVSLEGWFKIKVGDYLINGRIDRIDQNKDGSLHIVDYKTGKAKEKVTGDDKDQLLIYQLAAQSLPEYKNIGPVAELTFYYLNDNIKTSFIGKDKELEKLQIKLARVMEKIHERDFKATPGKFVCNYCDFKGICEYKR